MINLEAVTDEAVTLPAAQSDICFLSYATVVLMQQLPAWMWLQYSRILGILIPRRQSFASPISLSP